MNAPLGEFLIKLFTRRSKRKKWNSNDRLQEDIDLVCVSDLKSPSLQLVGLVKYLDYQDGLQLKN